MKAPVVVPVECPSGPLHKPVHVAAEHVVPGDRFWWPELEAWREVIDVSRPSRQGRVEIELRSQAERPSRLAVSRWAHDLVVVESPRQRRESPVQCLHCGTDTTSGNRICPSTECADAECRVRGVTTGAAA